MKENRGTRYQSFYFTLYSQQAGFDFPPNLEVNGENPLHGLSRLTFAYKNYTKEDHKSPVWLDRKDGYFTYNVWIYGGWQWRATYILKP